MNILFGEVNASISREDIFKPTIGNESLHEICNENGGVIEANCSIQKSTCQEYNDPTS
jgi:hypothetical protein